MNDLLNDIETLKKVTKTLSLVVGHGQVIEFVLPELMKMIEEKQKSVTEFEKQAPTHIQDLCNQLRGAI